MARSVARIRRSIAVCSCGVRTVEYLLDGGNHHLHSRLQLAVYGDHALVLIIHNPNWKTTAIFDEDLLKPHLELVQESLPVIVRHQTAVQDAKQILRLPPLPC